MDVWRKTKPKFLRNPGQSIDEKIDRLINDKLLSFYLGASSFWLIAFLEWTAKIADRPRLPGTYAIAAAIFTAVAGCQFWRIRCDVRNLKQGREGEREVAEFLDDLKQSGVRVVHDVPVNNFNVEHVVISTRGIFAIETKKWSKSKNRAQIEFDGQRITVSGKPSDYDPIKQCRAQAAWVQGYLKTSTSKRIPVRGVVAFPGWWVEQLPAARGADLWVLNPKALAAWIAREPEILTEADAAMATLHLQQYVRNC
jgi:Nuclease-related domain